MRIGPRAAVWLLPLCLLVPILARAQDSQPPAPPPGSAPQADNQAPPQGTVPPSAVKDSDHFSNEQLDQMLAPIALYPDNLVGQILMASTYPAQIVEAHRWLANPGHAALKGQALVAALQPEPWDPSVKSLAAFPKIVDLLNDNLDMTQALGAAFTGQQQDVWAQVQFLRAQAEKSGHLQSNQHIAVQNNGPNNIAIAPADPAVLTVPYYNPAVVYGPWPYPAYPPVFFPGLYFGVGPLALGVGWAWGPAWPIYAPLWGWYGIHWGFGPGIFINSGLYAAISFGHVGWHGGGYWHHVGGYAAFHGGVRAGYARGYHAGMRHGYRAGIGHAYHGGRGFAGRRAGIARGAVHGPMMHGFAGRGGMGRGLGHAGFRPHGGGGGGGRHHP